jgi:hypothetical protein
MPTSTPGFISSSLVYIDKKSNLVPFLSSATNSVNLFQKIIVFPLLSLAGSEIVKNNHYFSYINNKRFSKCFLLLIPGFGNYIYASNKKPLSKEKTENAELEKALKLVEKTDPKNLRKTLTSNDLKYEKAAFSAIEKVDSYDMYALIKLFPDALKNNENICVAIIKNIASFYKDGYLTTVKIIHEKAVFAAIERIDNNFYSKFVKNISPNLLEIERIAFALIQKSGIALEDLPKMQENEEAVITALATADAYQLKKVIHCISDKIRSNPKVQEAIVEAEEKIKIDWQNRNPHLNFQPNIFGIFDELTGNHNSYEKMFGERALPGAFLNRPKDPWVCPDELESDISPKGTLIKRILKAQHDCGFDLSASNDQLDKVLYIKSSARETLCEMLNAKSSTSDAELKKMYKKAAIQVHVDKNFVNINAQQAFVYLNQAYVHSKLT